METFSVFGGLTNPSLSTYKTSFPWLQSSVGLKISQGRARTSDTMLFVMLIVYFANFSNW